jgi:hypothetical protein
MRGQVQVRGPHGFKQIAAGGVTFHGLIPGHYSVRPLKVEFTHPVRGIPTGSTAFPRRKSISVRTKRSHTTKVTVEYGTIKSVEVITLAKEPAKVFGSPESPTAIKVVGPTALLIRPGSILAKAPSAGLPAGLFHEVTAVHRSHGQVIAQLTPASIWKAFPALNVESETPLEPVSATPDSGPSGRTLLGDFDLSFSQDVGEVLSASCGGPPSGWHFQPDASLKASLTTDIHRGFLDLPFGKLVLNLKGKLGFTATIPAGAHCGVSVDAGKIQGVVLIGDVPVPVEGGVTLNLTLQNDSPITATAETKVTSSDGVNLDGLKSSPIVSISQSTTGAVRAGAGSITLGPQVQVGLGATVANGHVAIEPQLIASASHSSCELAVGVAGSVGLDLGPLHADYTPFSPQTPVYQCPVPDGVYFEGGAGSGPPPSTLGPYTMTKFGPDPQPIGPVSSVAGPTGQVGFAEPLEHLLVGEGWQTWSNGYEGDVYMSGENHTATVQLPPGTHAFYLYAEPNVFADFSVSATTSEGITSGPITVYGESGASYFGFYATGSKTLSTITVHAEDVVAIGEFGISR